MLGHDDLVGGDHVLAGPDRALEVAAHRLISARHLQHDVDRGVLEHLRRICRHQLGCDLDRARLFEVADEHLLKAELDAGSARELRPPCQHPLRHLRTHGAQADQPDV